MNDLDEDDGSARYALEQIKRLNQEMYVHTDHDNDTCPWWTTDKAMAKERQLRQRLQQWHLEQNERAWIAAGKPMEDGQPSNRIEVEIHGEIVPL